MLEINNMVEQTNCYRYVS